jgi:large subunit ribosomal protein L21
MYAILSHGGRQYRVSAGDRLLVDRLEVAVGSVVALEPVLLTGGDGQTGLGKDLDGMRVAVTVLAHRRGRKLRIFKYKAKKRSRKMAGYRSDLTELRVESILAKGAALPKATVTSAGGTAQGEAVANKRTPAARTAATARAQTSASTAAVDATATAHTPATAATPRQKSTSKRTPAGTATSATAGARAVDASGTAESSSSASETAKPKAAASTPKVSPKTSKRGAGADGKETSDGA